jgi:hypothetical protein
MFETQLIQELPELNDEASDVKKNNNKQEIIQAQVN